MSTISIELTEEQLTYLREQAKRELGVMRRQKTELTNSRETAKVAKDEAIAKRDSEIDKINIYNDQIDVYNTQIDETVALIDEIDTLL